MRLVESQFVVSYVIHRILGHWSLIYLSKGAFTLFRQRVLAFIIYVQRFL